MLPLVNIKWAAVSKKGFCVTYCIFPADTVDWPEWRDWYPTLLGGSLTLTAGTPVATGTLLGAGVGGLIETDRREEGPLDRFRVDITPNWDGRIALALSVSF